MEEYIRLDSPVNSLYQNMFGAGLDARAILGDQILVGEDALDWTTAKYVGSALVDATIAVGIASTDWAEMGLLYIEATSLGTYDGFSQWALGRYRFGDAYSLSRGPYLGCNNDRMTHVPKGRLCGDVSAMISEVTVSE